MDNTPAMFQPSNADVRRFFCSVYAKTQAQQALDALETIASLWIAEHPEHHAALANLDVALTDLDQGKRGEAFLHLAMHLSLSEQCSIDQPRGIRLAVERLTQRRDSLHDAHHEAMECLGQMLWDAQRNGTAPDGEAYVAAVSRRATHD